MAAWTRLQAGLLATLLVGCARDPASAEAAIARVESPSDPVYEAARAAARKIAREREADARAEDALTFDSAVSPAEAVPVSRVARTIFPYVTLPPGHDWGRTAPRPRHDARTSIWTGERHAWAVGTVLESAIMPDASIRFSQGALARAIDAQVTALDGRRLHAFPGFPREAPADHPVSGGTVDPLTRPTTSWRIRWPRHDVWIRLRTSRWSGYLEIIETAPGAVAVEPPRDAAGQLGERSSLAGARISRTQAHRIAEAWLPRQVPGDDIMFDPRAGHVTAADLDGDGVDEVVFVMSATCIQAGFDCTNELTVMRAMMPGDRRWFELEPGGRGWPDDDEVATIRSLGYAMDASWQLPGAVRRVVVDGDRITAELRVEADSPICNTRLERHGDDCPSPGHYRQILTWAPGGLAGGALLPR